MPTSRKRNAPLFGPADERLLQALRVHDEGLRALLCTLARRGVALRRAAPQRAGRWLDELAPHPLFKAGQFLFDLLEWEDFMLDGAPPPLLDANTVRVALDRVTQLLRSIGAALDGEAATAMTIDLAAGADGARLPALESSFYLFQEVVLGAISLLAQPQA
ncbi:MAG TPA: hypothetical protein VF319_08300 [Caldimonas sp.]